MHYDTDPRDGEHNGQRLARLRLRKRPKMTQQQLADAVGYSLGTIKKIEQGVRSLDRGQQILSFAEALGCHPAEITGSPYPAPPSDPDAQTAASAIAGVHRALLMHDRPSRISEAEAAAVDLPSLAARVQEALRFRQMAALARSGVVLPGLLRDLQIAAALTNSDDRRRAYGLLASGYECAMAFADRVGHVAVCTLAVERIRLAVAETGDPLRIMSAEWYWAGEFIAVGEHDAAGDLIDGVLTGLDHHERAPQVVSLQGMFHLKAALNSARAADATGAQIALGHAAAAAEDLGEDRNDFELCFGPSNVAVWSVSIPIEFGRGREAVRLGEGLRLPDTFAAERRCHFKIDLGRAHYLNGQRDQALDAFLEAEQIGPQYTRMHPAVRETVGAMHRTAPRGRLGDLALRVGVV